MQSLSPDMGTRLKQLLRHMVSLTWVDFPATPADTSPARGQMVTGFVIAIDGVWIWVTAGHICESIKELSSKRRIERLRFCDAWGGQFKNDTTFPFPYSLDDLVYIHDQENGVDYGVQILGHQPAALLNAAGIMPIEQECWTNTPTDINTFALIGFPTSTMSVEVVDNKRMTLKGSAFAAPIEFLKTVPTELIKPYCRFYGRLVDLDAEGLPNGACLADIDGMSGGPIFGLKSINGEIKYWLIAIQSGWFPERRIVTACLIANLTMLLKDVLEQAKNAIASDGGTTSA